MESKATLESIRQHPMPSWFEGAKLGIFIHWGPYSVPGWAPVTGELNRVIAREGWPFWFAHNPYAEWYLNSMMIPGSPTYDYHQKRYGPNYSYARFVAGFEEATKRWNPASWADLFSWVGARYVILTAKHHDGYLLWPSWYPNPKKARYQSDRDLVWELSEAVRDQKMKFGLYYSGGLDWTFGGLPIKDLPELVAAIPQRRDYASYVDQHWRELVDRYEPSVLWNDMGYPGVADLVDLLAFYYNRVPEGVVNDRFNQVRSGEPGSLRNRVTISMLKMLVSVFRKRAQEQGEMPVGVHYDFRTAEYTTSKTTLQYKWEATRGLGYSFGYNQNETEQHLLSVEGLIRLLVDVVSKNGNLLLNIGPMADGTIPKIQEERLAGLGDWLRLNGEGIYDTRPWVIAEGQTRLGSPVRFTQRGSTLYAFLIKPPKGSQVALEGLQSTEDCQAGLLGQALPLDWQQAGNSLVFNLPENLPESPVYTIRMIPQPRWVGLNRNQKAS